MPIARRCAKVPGSHGVRSLRERFALARRRVLASAVLLLALTGIVLSPSTHAFATAPDSVLGAVTVSAEELIELAATRDDLVVIDSRKPFDWGNGHLDGAVHIVNTEMTAAGLAAVAKREQPVVFYCNGPKCLRSGDATTKAVAWGWTRVYWFRGGIEEWTEKNYPLTK